MVLKWDNEINSQMQTKCTTYGKQTQTMLFCIKKQSKTLPNIREFYAQKINKGPYCLSMLMNKDSNS